MDGCKTPERKDPPHKLRSARRMSKGIYANAIPAQPPPKTLSTTMQATIIVPQEIVAPRTVNRILLNIVISSLPNGALKVLVPAGTSYLRTP